MSKTNWRNYYGHENYDTFVKEVRRKNDEHEAKFQAERAKEKELQASIPVKPMLNIPGCEVKFDHFLIEKMSTEQFNTFYELLTDEEKNIFYAEKETMDEQSYENELMAEEAGEDYQDYDDCDYY